MVDFRKHLVVKCISIFASQYLGNHFSIEEDLDIFLCRLRCGFLQVFITL